MMKAVASPPPSFEETSKSKSMVRLDTSVPKAFPTLSSSVSDGSCSTILGHTPRLKSSLPKITSHQSTMSSDYDLLGEFSFAPATQTTVVTTTTTTTTSFPPLIMKAPRHLHELDSKLYPLAASPTPQSIKRFCIDVGGRPTVFREADDAAATLGKFQQQQQALRNSNGIIQQVKTSRTQFETPKIHPHRSAKATAANHTPTSNTRTRSRRKPSLPVWQSEVEKDSNHEHVVKEGFEGNILGISEPYVPDTSQIDTRLSRLQACQTSTPLTPSLDSSTMDDVMGGSRARRLYPDGDETIQTRPVNERLRDSTARQTLSPRPELGMDIAFEADVIPIPNEETEPLERPRSTQSPAGSFTSKGKTRPHRRSHFLVDGVPNGPFRPRPAILDTTAAQDISLPSPSLSPVTAAANLQNRRGYFEDLNTSAECMDSAVSSATCGNRERNDTESASEYDDLSWSRESLELDQRELPRKDELNREGPKTSITEIPAMLDFFEAMPTEMKSYVMYQLLRRCPKPVLHVVADAVNPTLKIDFLSLLPVELSQAIIGNLDVRDLCRAAQVSKKWRQIVNGDEKIWKRLFDLDGFVLPPGELQLAIRAGWGWQHPSGNGDFERDLSDLDHLSSEAQLPLSSPSNIDSLTSITNSEPRPQTAQSRRSKRKVAVKPKPTSRKQPKRKEATTQNVAEFDTEAFMRHVSISNGPFAAAKAAAVAVPSSKIGVPSLRSIHLYKSIYRRHYLIRKTWMDEQIKPKHIAFKAHQRHVVTCLQFDCDKIITGSDDTNINIYDTRTGALRARLEGHEGGVWALQYEGNVLVSGSTDRSVRIWDIEKGICTQVFQGHTSTVRCLQILLPTAVGTAPDGRTVMMPKQPLIITGSRDSHLRVWKLPQSGDPQYFQIAQQSDDAECPYFVRALTGHIHSVRAIAAHADTLVSGSYDHSVRVWKISTGETSYRLQGHAQKVYSVVLDHERNRCISGSMDNLVKVWSLDTGSCLYNLEGHSSLVGLLDLQQNRLVSAAADSTLRIWDPENGYCRSTLRAHTGAITCFQHDGQKVISGSDRTLKMWNVNTGEFVKDLLTDLSGVWQVKFDERRCVAAVQRNNLTYIEVLDFGASRDGVPEAKRGRRIVVNTEGDEVLETNESAINVDIIPNE